MQKQAVVVVCVCVCVKGKDFWNNLNSLWLQAHFSMRLIRTLVFPLTETCSF